MMERNWTLETFCQAFKIATANCTCTNENIPNFVKALECLIPSTTLKPRVEFAYTKASLYYALITLIASLIGIVGNSLVLLVAWRNHNSYLVCQKLIATLSGTDFLFGCIQLIMCIPTLWTYEWLYGLVTCKILLSFHQVGGVIAIGFIVMISVERCLGVVKPMYDSYRLIMIFCCLNGCFSVITAIPLLISYGMDDYNVCQPLWNKTSDLIYTLYILIATCIIPAIIVMVLYFTIIYKFRQSVGDKQLKDAMDEKLYKKRVRENQRIVKIVLALITALVIFVFPSRIIAVYLDLESVSNQTYEILTVISLVTYPFHVAINPILYSVIDIRWRNEIVKIFKPNMRRERYSSSFGQVPNHTPMKTISRVNTEQSIILDDNENPTVTTTTKL